MLQDRESLSHCLDRRSRIAEQPWVPGKGSAVSGLTCSMHWQRIGSAVMTGPMQKVGLRWLTYSMHACVRPMLEGRPSGVPGRFHRAAPVIHGISTRPRYHLQYMADHFSDDASPSQALCVQAIRSQITGATCSEPAHWQCCRLRMYFFSRSRSSRQPCQLSCQARLQSTGEWDPVPGIGSCRF